MPCQRDEGRVDDGLLRWSDLRGQAGGQAAGCYGRAQSVGEHNSRTDGRPRHALVILLFIKYTSVLFNP